MSFEIHPKKRVPVKLKTPLAEAFGFDFGDLQDNRMGFISNWQKGRLRWHLLSNITSLIKWLFGVVLSSAIFIGGLIALFSDDFSWTEKIAIMAIIVITFSVITVSVFGIVEWLGKIGGTMGDMRLGKVTQISDVVHHHREYRTIAYRNNGREGSYREFDYYLDIGKERFPVFKVQMQAFSDGAEYSVYITPKSRQILSAELLKEDDLDEFEREIFYGAEKTKLQIDEA